MSNQNLLQRMTTFADSPQGRAFVDTLGYTEGADYDTVQGYVARVDPSFRDHPRIKGPLSDAAGKPQFLSTTWDETRKALGLPDFSPRSQRIGAAYLADRRLRGAGLGGVEAISKHGMSPDVVAALAPEWASFPTRSGRSYYGQPVKKLSELQQVYARNLKGGAATPGRPVTTPAGTSAPEGMGEDKETLAALTSLFSRGSNDQLSAANLGIPAVPGIGSIGDMRMAAIPAFMAAMPALMSGDPQDAQQALMGIEQARGAQAMRRAHGQIASALVPGSIGASATDDFNPVMALLKAQQNDTPAAVSAPGPASASGTEGAGIGGRLKGGAITQRKRDPDAEKTGWDIVHPGGRGAPIQAPVDLVITGTGFQGHGAGSGGRGYGKWVSGEFELDGKRQELLIGHFDEIDVKPGMRIPAGARIGSQGITGRTFGTHATTHVNPKAGATVDDAWKALSRLTDIWERGT